MELSNIEGIECITTDSGLKYYITHKSESSDKPRRGSKVDVHYSGFLTNGKMFDSSHSRNKKFTFTLGVGQVIKGWDEGVQLMNVGDKFQFHIPYKLAYGERGYPGVIPARATLIFDVELLGYK